MNNELEKIITNLVASHIKTDMRVFMDGKFVGEKDKDRIPPTMEEKERIVREIIEGNEGAIADFCQHIDDEAYRQYVILTDKKINENDVEKTIFGETVSQLTVLLLKKIDRSIQEANEE